MKRETNQDELLADVIAGESDLRQRTREAALSALRGRRLRRRVGGAVVPVAVLITAAIGFLHSGREPIPQSAPNLVEAEKVIPGTKIHVLTDDELLDLFKGRPVALIGPPQDQRLVFLDGSAN